MSIGLAFESETSSNTISVPYPAFMFGKFGNHVIRAVINRFDTFKFSNLKDSYSNLESIKNFIKGYSYLAGINILVYAKPERETFLCNIGSPSDRTIVVKRRYRIRNKAFPSETDTRSLCERTQKLLLNS